MNIKITSEEIKILQKEYNTMINLFTEKDSSGYYGVNLYPNISLIKFGSGFSSKTYKIPKNKPVDKKWIVNKLEKESIYINLRNTFKKLNIKGNIYYTSFGFSYINFFKSKEVFEKETNILKNALNELGIEYKNEFSDACWVYRFRISKNKNNIDKINQL